MLQRLNIVKIKKRFKIKKSSISITHDGGFAIAVVVNSLKNKV